jgi:hypothetical protein
LCYAHCSTDNGDTFSHKAVWSRKKAKATRDQELVAQTATSHQFHIDGAVVGQVNQFKHLGRPILGKDSHDGAIRHNIHKAWAKWNLVAQILVWEEAALCAMGVFYKAVVQSVLLYCSKTWVLTLAQYEQLDVFASWECSTRQLCTLSCYTAARHGFLL